MAVVQHLSQALSIQWFLVSALVPLPPAKTDNSWMCLFREMVGFNLPPMAQS